MRFIIKRLTSVFIMLTLFLSSIAPFDIKVNAAGELPAFYQNGFYNGYSVSLDVGKYTLSDIISRGINNNDISSLKVPRGYKVIIFDGNDLDGESISFTENVPSLAYVEFQNLTNWNDKISSIEVCKIETGLLARYYDNMDLTDLVAQRVDPVINFNSIQDFMCPIVNGNTFSVRWSGEIEPLYTGTYTFYTTSDEGVKLTIDNKTVVDNWTGHTSTVNSGNISLESGKKHMIDIIYYQKYGNANMKLEWYCPSGQARQVVPTERLYPESTLTKGEVNGIKATYCQDKSFSPNVFSRIDQKIDFNWQNNSPHALIENNAFSVIWQGEIVPRYNGTYNFYTTSDDGVKLTINQTVIIDRLYDQSGVNSGAMELKAGQRYPIKLQYYDNEGNANIKLEWECSSGQVREVIPQSCFISKYGTGLSASYYDAEFRMPTTYYNHDCYVVRTDTNVNFNWTTGVEPETDECRRIIHWEGKIEPKYTGNYTFYIPANGGISFHVGLGSAAPRDNAYAEHWVDEGQYEAKVDYFMRAGWVYNIDLELFGIQYAKNIKLEWSCPGIINRQVIPSGNLYPLLSEYNGTFYRKYEGIISGRDSEITYTSSGCLNYFNGNKLLQDKLIDKAMDVIESASRFKFRRVETGGKLNFEVQDKYPGYYIATEQNNKIIFYNKNYDSIKADDPIEENRYKDLGWPEQKYYTTVVHELGHVLGLVDVMDTDRYHSKDALYNAQFNSDITDYSIMDYCGTKNYPSLSEYDIAFVQGIYGAPEHKPLVNIYIDTDSTGQVIHDTLASSSWPEANRIARANKGDSKVSEVLGTMPVKPMPDTRPLYRYKINNTGKSDYILTTSTNVSSSYTFDCYLGEIYKTAKGDRIPLYRFYNSSENDYTVATCNLSYDNKYTSRTVLGYIDSLNMETWVDDEFPQNAIIRNTSSFNWVTDNPIPYSGLKAHQSVLATGVHQHFFDHATQVMEVGSGQTLFCNIYIDPSNIPQTIMLQWYDTSGSWSHRAYWGQNKVTFGNDNTEGRRYMGNIPASGGWVRLEVPASLVGLEGKAVSGMAYTLYDGKVTWDKAGVCS